MPTDLVPIRRALISVSDKTGLEPLVRALAARNVEIVSTGGTARAIEALGVPAVPVERLTGFPEMMDGRLKTLHPRVHGGLLAVRDDPAHARAMSEHHIAPIDLVCINLYPFEQTVTAPGATETHIVEQIDIGGPAMVRSAAKNHAFVAVVTGSHQYQRLITELEHHQGATTLVLRRELAAAAFARTAAYDSAIAAWFGAPGPSGASDMPEVLRLAYPKHLELRYGENPHQHAALYRDPSWKQPGNGAGASSVVWSTQLHGKELSYNNINDAAAALALCDDLAMLAPERVSSCVIKHANPCGAASAIDAYDAVDGTLTGDPLAAYGGILACSAPIDVNAARRLTGEGVFLEVILAPSFAPGALDILRERWSSVRLLATGHLARPMAASTKHAAPLTVRTIPGGALAQRRDTALPDISQWQHRAGPEPSGELLGAAAFAWVCVKHLSSNAVAIAVRAKDAPGAGARLIGAGAGQMDRVTACRLACEKAGPRARGAVACSDAFFPFADGPQLLIDAGVSLIAHTGGSKRDHETFELCDRRAVTCLTTGLRHFRH